MAYELVPRSQEWQLERPGRVRERFTRVSILPNNRVVFRVRGIRYRLVVQVDYRKGIVVVVFFGTHPEYDRFDAEEG